MLELQVSLVVSNQAPSQFSNAQGKFALFGGQLKLRGLAELSGRHEPELKVFLFRSAAGGPHIADNFVFLWSKR